MEAKHFAWRLSRQLRGLLTFLYEDYGALRGPYEDSKGAFVANMRASLKLAAFQRLPKLFELSFGGRLAQSYCSGVYKARRTS